MLALETACLGLNHPLISFGHILMKETKPQSGLPPHCQKQGGLGLVAAETADLEFATRWHQEQLSVFTVLRNWDSALNSVVQ